MLDETINSNLQLILICCESFGLSINTGKSVVYMYGHQQLFQLNSSLLPIPFENVTIIEATENLLIMLRIWESKWISHFPGLFKLLR